MILCDKNTVNWPERLHLVNCIARQRKNEMKKCHLYYDDFYCVSLDAKHFHKDIYSKFFKVCIRKLDHYFSETDKDDLIKEISAYGANIKLNQLMRKSTEFGKRYRV